MLSRSSLTLLALYSITQVNAFVVGRPAQSVRNTRLFYDTEEEQPETEAAVGTQTVFGLDEDFVAFPSPAYEGTDIVDLCMNALLENGLPYDNAGLEVCWNFSSDRCRAAQGGSFDHFIQFASNPVFASLVDAKEWSVVRFGNLIPGTQTRGAMQTVLTKVVSQEGRAREFLWTLQRERRPPRQNCWLVHECISKDAAYDQTM